MFRRILFAALLLFPLAGRALAQEAWVLTRADFSHDTVDLRSIDADGIKAVLPGGSDPASIPFDQVLQLDRASAAASNSPFTLQLLGGDRLTGQPAAIKDDAIVWNSPALGQISVPIKFARALLTPGATAGDEPRKEDWVFLKNSDKVTGAITALDNSTLSINANGSVVPVPLTSINSVEFALTEKPSLGVERAFRVKLLDGSVVTASAVQYPVPSAVHSVLLKLSSGDKTVDVTAIAGIEQINGPVSWLSTRTPSENVQIPMLGRVWPAQMDLNVDGKPIQVGESTFSRGIGVHSYSRMVYPLDGTYRTFRTQFAIDGNREKANVTVRVKLDDKVVYEQKDVVTGKLWPVINIDLGSAKSLTLEVDYGPTSWVQGHFDWIEPALLKSAAPAATNP